MAAFTRVISLSWLLGFFGRRGSRVSSGKGLLGCNSRRVVAAVPDLIGGPGAMRGFAPEALVMLFEGALCCRHDRCARRVAFYSVL